MKRLIAIPLLLITLLTASCAPAATDTPFVMDTNQPQASPVVTDTPEPTETPGPTFTAAPSHTPLPTFGPTQTETLLPELVLPSPETSEPIFAVWDGVPTYLGDSLPGFYFRVTYNTRAWALTTDSYGQPALAHRDIPYCVIAPNLSGGLAPGLQVEHDMRKIGELFFEINIILEKGVRQYVTYQATDGVILTGFQVNFEEQADECLTTAEIVLGTLTSVPQSQATPVP